LPSFYSLFTGLITGWKGKKVISLVIQKRSRWIKTDNFLFLSAMQQRLVILDLNGFLVHRIHERDTYDLSDEFLKTADKHARPFFIWKRPHADEFLQFIFQHFSVAVWTSARKQNADQMLSVLLTPDQRRELLFEWNQAHCGKKKINTKKRFLFTKPLAKVWATFSGFDATNTLIIDDSPEKMVDNPPSAHYAPLPWPGPTYGDDTELSLKGNLCNWLRL